MLVDVGCGRGRVILWWLSRGYRNKIYGLEIDPALADTAAKNVRKFGNVEIISGDAVSQLPPDGTVFYMFNPFHLQTVLKFKKSFAEKYPPGTTIIYYYPTWLEVFRKDPAWEVSEFPFEEKVSRLALLRKPWTAVMKYNPSR